MALASIAPVLVEDVANDPIFRGTTAAPVMEAAGVRACASFPILARSGRVEAMLNVHFGERRTLSDRELTLLSSVADRVGRLI